LTVCQAFSGSVLGRALQFHDGAQTRAGVFRVEVDAAGAQRLVRHQRAAEVDLALDLEARLLERGGVKLGDDELLGEVLRADLQGLRRRRSGEGQRGEHRHPDPHSSSPCL
jgi:hypothetical protein